MNENHASSTEMSGRYRAYTIGFILSIILTLCAYLLVAHHVMPVSGLILVISGLAAVQLIIQLVFFLHLGNEKGPRWRLMTFALAVIVIFIMAGGSIWIMDNLNSKMMHMSPKQELQYMHNNEGI